jgi:hypothetical protein
VERGIQDAIKVLVQRHLNLQEVLDSLLAKYYTLEADVKEMALHNTDWVMT